MIELQSAFSHTEEYQSPELLTDDGNTSQGEGTQSPTLCVTDALKND